MTEVINTKASNQGVTNTEAADKAARKSKGHALAELILTFTNKEVQASIDRAQKRMVYVNSISKLDPDGHSAFRGELQRTLEDARQSARAMAEEGMTKENEAKIQGYSLNSFVVMVSNWRTLSMACEMGMPLINEDAIPLTWEESLANARTYRAAAASNGVTLALGTTRKAGGGRKAGKVKTDYDKALILCVKLSKGDRAKIIAAMSAMV